MELTGARSSAAEDAHRNPLTVDLDDLLGGRVQEVGWSRQRCHTATVSKPSVVAGSRCQVIRSAPDGSVSRVTSREAADPLHAVTASARAEAIQEERLATGYTILVVRIRFSVCHGECKSVELSMRQLTRVLRSLRR